MAATLGEAFGIFLVSLFFITLWFGAAWKIPALKRRQDVAHYIAFAMGWGLIYISTRGAGGVTLSHMLGGLLMMTYVGVRAYRRISGPPQI